MEEMTSEGIGRERPVMPSLPDERRQAMERAGEGADGAAS